MNPWFVIKKSVLAATVFLFAFLSSAYAQDNQQTSEVYLTFQYRGVVSVFITTYYKDNQFYLPVGELFNQLEINHNINQGTLTISGNYLGEKEYLLDFKTQVANAGDTQIQLQAEDFLIREIDYFVRPSVLQELFGLNFTTDFNNLSLDLETVDKMPVVAQYERELDRKRLQRDQPLYDRSFYPLKYDRDYGTIDGAFIDYNLSAGYSNNTRLFTFSNAIGAELLGGDVQGNLFGTFSEQQSSFITSGLRWRYVQRDNRFFSNAILGQTNSEGIGSRPITGFKISNKPVEPRKLFDRYVIDGNVAPQSEVELYLNNRLVDYQETDETGNYRFVVPLTYGNTNYSLRFFTSTGQSFRRNARIQIPFDYLPPGEIDYNISGGQLNNPILGTTERGFLGEASVSTGVTQWLTARVSSEYLTDYHTSRPSFTGTLNARLFSKYLLSANFNSENFYRFTSSVVYSSGASWSISYDYNPGTSRLYNIGGNDHEARFDLFTPFQIGSLPLNIRWGTTYQQNGPSRLLRYRADLNTRMGRLNVRLGYQDQQAGNLSLETTSSSRLTNSYTYSVGRFNNFSSLLRGLFIRGQVSYLPGLKKFESMEFQLSRDIRQTGRVQLTFGRNFLGNFNSLSLNFTIDFSNFRSNTTSRTTGSEIAVTQNVRGSIGYDPYGDQLLLNNRQQVGQSGAAVRLFVDNNNDGAYQESTDDVITDPAVRLNRSGGRTSVKNGINYITQLLPYYRYDIEINKGVLSNPLLVPYYENFSIVTDPNQYKNIEIPFYRSGVISGVVERLRDSTRSELSGVRLYLQSDYGENANREPFSKEMQTFSDGSFYTYEIPPGTYNLYIDPTQLDFLNSVSNPDTMKVEVEALAEGDFIEGLNFTVTPASDTLKTKEIISDADQANVSNQELYYKIQLASFNSREKAEEFALEAAQRLGGSFSVIQNTSNNLFAIRSIPLSDREQAIETIISYHNSAYKSAALVVLQNKQKKASLAKTKFIQIGAFSTKKRAENFASSSSLQLNKETAITHDTKLDLYKVYVNERFSANSEREAQLTSIHNSYTFRNAYINERNNIQLGAFNKHQHAHKYAQQSGDILGVKTGVFYDDEENHYNVFVDESFGTDAEKKSKLSEVRNTPSPFYDAFVSEFEDSTYTNPANQDRPMHFTYRVQIEGVSEETEQAFLSSMIDSDIELNRPQKDLVIFDQVSTWNEAQEFQRKLRKVASNGHPIVVLIENTENAPPDN